MSNKDYNYEIEELLSQYGDKPDSGEERICGNCFLYDSDHWRCCHYENAEDGGFYDETESGCWYHRTHEEQKRLAAYIKKHCEEASRLRLEEQRRNGTGECAGCPFRNVNKELYDFAHFFETFAGECYCKILGEAGQKIYNEAVKICKKARGEE